VDAALDWHHGALRRGAAALVFARIFAGSSADAATDPSLKEHVAILRLALKQLENYWLEASAPFLGGAEAISIADLVCAAEVAQLALLDAPGVAPPSGAALLAPHARVRAWLAAVEAATAPHWGDVTRGMHATAALVAAAAPQQPAAKL
jgi:glutathione S-transferase